MMSLGHEDAMSVFPSFFINLLLLPVEAPAPRAGAAWLGLQRGWETKDHMMMV